LKIPVVTSPPAYSTARAGETFTESTCIPAS
jgi:hypothetical protein